MPTAAGMYFAMSDGGQKDQPPVILLHGAGSNHQSWPAVIRRLNGQRVFAVDLAGHGRSQGVGMQSIAAYADQLVEFLAALGLYQAVFTGHGLGGAIALDLAIRHPAHVAGLALIATGAYLGVPPDLLENFANSYTLSNALHIFQQRAFSPATPPGVVDRCITALKGTRASVMAADWLASAEFDVRPSVGLINAPAWVIIGAEDQLTPVAFAHFLAGNLPAARLQIIPNAGHMVFLEQPERVAQGLQQFLAAMAAARYAAARLSPSTAQVTSGADSPADHLLYKKPGSQGS